MSRLRRNPRDVTTAVTRPTSYPHTPLPGTQSGPKSIQAIEKLAPRVMRVSRRAQSPRAAPLRISGGNKPYAEMHNDEDLVPFTK